MNWTEQQLAVFALSEQGTGSFNVKARAGTSKTTTGVEVSKRIQGQTLLCAYNKSISDELAARIVGNPNARAATTHSVGFSLLRKLLTVKCDMDTRKDRGLAQAIYRWDKAVCDAVTSAVSLAKQSGFGIPGLPSYNDPEAWTELMELYDLWDEIPDGIDPDRIIKDCSKIYKQSIDLAKNEGRITFDDMLVLPLMLSTGKCGMYDTVIGDEVQDLSNVRRLMILHVVRDGGRVIGLGDDRQAIYQWCGASHDSMQLLKDATGASELPLTITFRCPRLIVEMAQKWVPDYQAHESAPEGKISIISHSDLWLERFSPEDVILCRNRRPLIGIAKRLRDMGVPCIVEGQNGKALVSLATKWGDIDLKTLDKRLNEYRDREVSKWRVLEREDKVEWVQEKVGILLDLMDGMQPSEPVRRLVNKMETMFGYGQQTQGNVLRLSTIHAAKGKEFDKVYLVGRNVYQPSKWAKTKEDFLAEENLSYVAVTRTKKELVEVMVPPVKDQGQGDWWDE